MLLKDFERSPGIVKTVTDGTSSTLGQGIHNGLLMWLPFAIVQAIYFLALRFFRFCEERFF